MCWALKDRSLSREAVVGDIEDLDKVWDTLNTCYNRSEKYITEALDPIIKFQRYQA